MVRTLETYKEELFEQIEDLKERIVDLGNFEQDNQLDVTEYMRNTFSPAGVSPDVGLRHDVFIWCFDNDIHYKILNKEVYSPMNFGQISFIFMEFKNQADLVAFKLRWMSSNNNSWNEEREMDDDDIPF